MPLTPDDSTLMRVCLFCKGYRGKVVIPVGKQGTPMCSSCAAQSPARLKAWMQAGDIIKSAEAIVAAFQKQIGKDY